MAERSIRMVARFFVAWMAAGLVFTGSMAGSGDSRDQVVAWRLEADLPAPDPGLSEPAAWRAIGVTVAAPRLSSGGVTLSGTHDVAALRGLLFGGLPPDLDLLGGPVDLTIEGRAVSGGEMRIALACNFSTGSVWDLSGEGWAITREPLDLSDAGRPGAVGRQTFWVRRTGGEAPLRLAYRRPWRRDDRASRSLRLSFSRMPEVIDLTDPRISRERAAAPPARPDPPPVGIDPGAPAVDLPPYFDWRDYGILPAARDQGDCGSCWAFAVTGVTEAVVALATRRPPANFSEQYLVSCDVDSNGCDGGWASAMDLHTTVIPASQSTPGPVLETDFRYKAKNGTCKGSLPHQPKLLRWVELVTHGPAVPQESTVKRALLDHGPLDAQMCVGKKLPYYDPDNGIFAKDETNHCNGGTNHDVVLVGWDDADGTWIVRNSWGSNWGEEGDVRIKRGISSLPSYPLYALFDPAPSVPPNRANDDPDSPEMIECGEGVVDFRVQQSIGDQQQSTDEPTFPGGNASYRKPKNMVWYAFAPSADGRLTLDTFDSNYDTIVGLWTASDGGFKLVAWNDDWAAGWSMRPSFLQQKVAAGVEYRIGVSSFDPKVSATLDLHLHFEPGTEGALLDDASTPPIVYSGSWKTRTRSLAYGTGIRVGRKSGKKTAARLDFEGTRVAVVYEIMQGAGTLLVRIDANPPVEISQAPTPGVPPQARKVFEITGLPPGSHVLDLAPKDKLPINLDAIAVGDAALRDGP